MKKLIIVSFLMMAFSGYSMNMAAKLVHSIRSSKTPVTINSVKGFRAAELGSLARSGRVVIAFTPGPWKPEDPLFPRTAWMANPKALGCTPELNALMDNIAYLNAKIYNVNTHSDEYQRGEEGLLSLKGYRDMESISDAQGTLQSELGLESFAVASNQYLARVTVAFNDQGEGRVFQLKSPVTPEDAVTHVREIRQFFDE